MPAGPEEKDGGSGTAGEKVVTPGLGLIPGRFSAYPVTEQGVAFFIAERYLSFYVEQEGSPQQTRRSGLNGVHCDGYDIH